MNEINLNILNEKEVCFIVLIIIIFYKLYFLLIYYIIINHSITMISLSYGWTLIGIFLLFLYFYYLFCYFNRDDFLFLYFISSKAKSIS